MLTPLTASLRHLAVPVLLLLAASANTTAADLVSLVKQAEQSDPKYQESQNQALAVAEEIPQANAALWKPQLAFTISGNQTDQEITAKFSLAGRGVGYNGSDYRVSLRQPVFHWDRYLQLKQADKRLHQAQLEIDVAWQALLVRVAERYFSVLAAQDTLTFAKSERDALAGQLEQAKQRFDVGLIAVTDVEEARAGHDRAVAQVITAENDLQNAEEALRESTGTLPTDIWTLNQDFKLAAPTPDNIDEWTAASLKQNLEIAAALTAADVAESDIGIASAGHLPTIDIEGSHGFDSRGGQFGSNESTTSSIGIRLNVPIYEGGAVDSRTRQAGHQHAVALDRVETARRGILRQTRQSFLGVLTQMSAVTALKQAVVSSATALESTRAGFEVGTRTTVDVILAERSLSQARRDLAKARYEYILNLLRLKQAAGTLGPDDIAVTNAWLKPAPDIAANTVKAP
jgi:outer membrane protein